MTLASEAKTILAAVESRLGKAGEALSVEGRHILEEVENYTKAEVKRLEADLAAGLRNIREYLAAELAKVRTGVAKEIAPASIAQAAANAPGTGGTVAAPEKTGADAPATK